MKTTEKKQKKDGPDSWFKKFLFSNSIYKRIVLWYLLITIIGAVLLYFPFSHQKDETISFLDAAFISASAFSDTGLTTLPVSETFNIIGELIIFFLILLGGIGWFTFKYFIITYILSRSFDRHVKRETTTNARTELGYENNYQTKEIIKITFFSMIIMILSFGIIFGLCFALIEPKNIQGVTDPNLSGNWSRSFWTGFFHANSSINNAGFDIFYGDVSMSAYYGNYFIQIITIFLFIFGGIGFAVIYDFWLYLKNKAKGAKFKFSLFTKIAVVTYFSVAFGGLFLVYIFEFIAIGVNKDTAFLTSQSINYGGFGERMWALTFNTFSTRNAGFSTMNLELLSPLSQFTHIVMMFIGSGPGSTAGGIRTTTTAVLIVSLFASMKKKKQTVIFNREIPRETIRFAVKILVFSLLLLIISSIFISIDELWTNKNSGNFYSYIDVLYVCASAFGTVGLSVVSLNNLNAFSIIWLILVMFIGQVGSATLLKVFQYDSNKLQNSYPGQSIYLKESLNLG